MPRYQPDPVSPAAMLTQATIAQVLGVSPRNIRQLTESGTLPRDRNTGRYPLADCVQAYLAHIRGRGKTGEEALDYERERARLTRAQADRAEVRLGRERGSLVPEAAARRALSGVLVPLRQELLSLEVSVPPKLEAVGTAAERREILGREIRSVLERLAHPDIRYEDGEAAFDDEPDDALRPDDPEECASSTGDS